MHHINEATCFPDRTLHTSGMQDADSRRQDRTDHVAQSAVFVDCNATLDLTSEERVGFIASRGGYICQYAQPSRCDSTAEILPFTRTIDLGQGNN